MKMPRALFASAVTTLGALSGLALWVRESSGPAGALPGNRPIVYVPPNLRTDKAPLLIALHGSGESPLQMESATGFDRLARAHSFIVAYLASHSPRQNWILPSETASIGSAIDRLEATEPIDPTRVYVTGFSSGGYESYRVGCLLSDQVAAIAPVGVSMNSVLYHTCKLSRPVSTLIVIGSADTGHYGGYGRLPSAPAAAAKWRALDGCPARSPSSSPAPGPTSRQIWSGCAEGSAVGLSVVAGGTHVWPGPRLGPSSPDGKYDASAAIWAFFASHRADSRVRRQAQPRAVAPQEGGGKHPLLTRNARSHPISLSGRRRPAADASGRA